MRSLALQMTVLSCAFFTVLLGTAIAIKEGMGSEWPVYLLIFPFALVASAPGFFSLWFGGAALLQRARNHHQRINALLAPLGFIVFLYALIFLLFALWLDGEQLNWWLWFTVVIALIAALLLTCLCLKKQLFLLLETPSIIIMNQEQTANRTDIDSDSSSRLLYKGIITGVLILIMLIPTLFISSLVQERKTRQQEVVEEVSARWGSKQQIGGLLLVLPYEIITEGAKGSKIVTRKDLVVLPDNLNVSAKLDPVLRKRSIYEVLLYRSDSRLHGEFTLRLPKDVSGQQVKWKEATICLGIRDIKGIEEKIALNFIGQQIELEPGLPSGILFKSGLSATVDLTDTRSQPLSFSTQVKLKGSEQLHFLPLAGNSNFAINSTWANPSFDGNSLPAHHEVSDSGFAASWSFSKANLPFGTILKENSLNDDDYAFGVTMVQPGDQYAKTERSVKYAILFIGLSFALFFVVELVQKKPVHPVQYVLIGIALSVFYTLLLSISEFIPFDYAYGIATLATVLLISAYAKAHFGLWRTAMLFGLVIGGLYTFGFVLIRLEDTALLIGSIGLFIVLALAMYGTRNINWYPQKTNPIPN